MSRGEARLMAQTVSHSDSDWVFVLQKRNDFAVSTRYRLCTFGNEYKIITKFHHGKEVRSSFR